MRSASTRVVPCRSRHRSAPTRRGCSRSSTSPPRRRVTWRRQRSEEHTSELQSRLHLVCRLLLEKKKKTSALTSRLKQICYILSESEKHHDARHSRKLNPRRPMTNYRMSTTHRCSKRTYGPPIDT